MAIQPLKKGIGEVLAAPRAEFLIGAFIIRIHQRKEMAGDILAGECFYKHPLLFQCLTFPFDIASLV